VLDLDRQEPLVRRPHIQTPQGLDWGSGARDWTGIAGRLGATDRVRDGGCDGSGL
jgi:hypothetical protein